MNSSFKYSGVHWLGKIPSHWNVIALKRYASYISRGRSPNYTDDKDKGIPIINQACIYWDGLRLENVKLQDSNMLTGYRGKIHPGDLLINSTGTGTLGRIGVFNLPGDYLADSHVTIVRPTKEVFAKYLYYILQTDVYQGYIYSVLATGATNQIELSREGLSNTPIIVPPPETQKSIAHFLDRKTAAIDTLIAKKQHLIQLLEEKRTALINQAVTKGLNSNVPIKDSGIPWIGEIPERWEVLRLRRLISDKVAGPYGSSLTKSMYVSAGYRVYGQQQVIPENFTVGDYYISPEKLLEMQRYLVQPKDVLVTVMGTIGRVAVVPEEIEPGIINPRLVKYVVRQKYILPHFFAWVFRSKAGEAQLSEMAQGVTMDGLNLTVLSDLWMPVPPLEEQNNIVTHIHKVTDKNDQLQSAVRKQIEKLQEYRRLLITAVVTGKLAIEEENVV